MNFMDEFLDALFCSDLSNLFKYDWIDLDWFEFIWRKRGFKLDKKSKNLTFNMS